MAFLPNEFTLDVETHPVAEHGGAHPRAQHSGSLQQEDCKIEPTWGQGSDQ